MSVLPRLEAASAASSTTASASFSFPGAREDLLAPLQGRSVEVLVASESAAAAVEQPPRELRIVSFEAVISELAYRLGPVRGVALKNATLPHLAEWRKQMGELENFIRQHPPTSFNKLRTIPKIVSLGFHLTIVKAALESNPATAAALVEFQQEMTGRGETMETWEMFLKNSFDRASGELSGQLPGMIKQERAE